MTSDRSIPTRRLSFLLGALALALAVSACGIGHKQSRPTAVTAAELNAGAEPYVFAGPLTYQVQISRQLNPWATEDATYLQGVPPADRSLAPDQLWYGVFLWAKNQTHIAVTTSDTFVITDSEGTTYHPIEISAAVNPYVWNAEKLYPGGTEPGPDTLASYAPTGGGLILFKLYDSVYANRPLTLHIFAPGQAKASTVSLDL